MTQVISRSPLQTLTMATAQRPSRRRSARGIDDGGNIDLDSRPTKKAKTDDATNHPLNSTKRRAGNTAQNNKAYDEDADGFEFSRKRSKKPNSVQGPAQDEAQEKPSRRKKSATPTADSVEGVPRRRRSARLSGEPVTSAPAKSPRKPRRDESPDPGDADRIHMPKRRDTLITLPFADTPVIARNKQMRKISGHGHRRSSSGMRGRRASSLIDSGASNALPHDQVDTADMYKHIAQDLPEPRRMKQLLLWCGARALPPRAPATGPDTSSTLAARVIQEELLKDFANKSEMSDWFSRDDDSAPTVLVKKPNPRNEQNAVKLQELEAEVKRLEGEVATWEGVLKSLDKSLDGSSTMASNATPSLQSVTRAALDDSEQGLVQTITSQPDASRNVMSRLQQVSQKVEFQVDCFADGVHRVDRFREMVEELADKTLEGSATALERRDQQSLQRAGMDKVNVLDVLRPLSRIAES